MLSNEWIWSHALVGFIIFSILFIILLGTNGNTDFCTDSSYNILIVWLSIFYSAGRFDVHSDTIIRTEESRSMGAKFLDDADLRLVYLTSHYFVIPLLKFFTFSAHVNSV
jgi:hypothetical protein